MKKKKRGQICEKKRKKEKRKGVKMSVGKMKWILRRDLEFVREMNFCNWGKKSLRFSFWKWRKINLILVMAKVQILGKYSLNYGENIHFFTKILRKKWRKNNCLFLLVVFWKKIWAFFIRENIFKLGKIIVYF